MHHVLTVILEKLAESPSGARGVGSCFVFVGIACLLVWGFRGRSRGATGHGAHSAGVLGLIMILAGAVVLSLGTSLAEKKTAQNERASEEVRQALEEFHRSTQDQIDEMHRRTLQKIGRRHQSP